MFQNAPMFGTFGREHPSVYDASGWDKTDPPLSDSSSPSHIPEKVAASLSMLSSGMPHSHI